MSALTADELLQDVKVASPCPARWSEMIGDERARFCAQCQKNVYNFSAMTAEEAGSLLREREGALCVRFYQRADGTVMTSDCFTGATPLWRSLTRLITAGGAVALASVTFWAADRGTQQENSNRSRGKIELAWDQAVGTIKGWLGMKPPTIVMGGTCAPRPPTRPPAPKPSTGSN